MDKRSQRSSEEMTAQNLDVFKAGSDVLVEVDGRNLGAELTDAVLVFDVVATEFVSIHLIPFILPPELLSIKTDTDIQPQNNYNVIKLRFSSRNNTTTKLHQQHMPKNRQIAN